MNSKAEQHKSSGGNAGDLVKYVLALALAAGGVFAYIWFENWSGPLRAAVVVAGLVAGAAVFMLSAKGAQTREFLSESRFELRKVVWPTRDEALKTTWVVMVAVLILSLILSGFDWVIQAAVKFLLAR
ncbi:MULTISPECIES: preprotein translocase subunit SecE [Lysobacter]|uniref:Protein translocase subunit SecE n=2 Tax=Lysobacter TaxID=68 RepID=A0A0S2DKG8_LYSEN|nr:MULTISPECIES: preprotein translocase subunit SecE [Lysobacter]ALN59147.1 preprotein translocase, SecE subunit [Lysobacter enzymogenes]QCW27374.1 preprotein translocase subunit SecE [Lysobacter enzymogenes]QQQ02682.1 preprotein translocase subunit SecE [Lysobacter enzymogenes]UZW62088.1 preprotein translocase subunit SecE [Lysobacter enzymogenes]WMT01098.1 preprotein translocase subunit SecE [Lysobacter yananisis]